jgi:hypothetical protein
MIIIIFIITSNMIIKKCVCLPYKHSMRPRGHTITPLPIRPAKSQTTNLQLN